MPPTLQNDLEEMARARQQATQQILTASSRKKLVVAGPGTGKTFTFRQALETTGAKGLALTFIRNLVEDLRRDLVEVADVFTFHGFCKHLLHRLQVPGLTSHFDFYPPFLKVATLDRSILGLPPASEDDLERALHYLDDSRGLVSQIIRLGNYYDAAGFVDVVYRVLKRLEASPSDTPTYPLIVVDEYQDFSLLETAFITRLAELSPVLIAGDDDQALYGFKHASANYIRKLATGGQFQRFGLPYCSRCTEVIVQAVNAIVNHATSEGKLEGRLAREFRCYLPEKLSDSTRYPRIIHAHCLVQTGRAPQLCRYVAEEISRIPAEEVAEAHANHYPAALVIGPMHFVRLVHKFLADGPCPTAALRQSEQLSVDVLDGYRRIAEQPESRLGWRIILVSQPCCESERILQQAVTNEEDLAPMLPASYRAEHLMIAALLDRLMSGDSLTDDDAARLSRATGRSTAELADCTAPAPDADVSTGPADQAEQPTVICTSLVGAKGLSAAHVFIVGFNDDHFPRHPSAITDDEVCSLIVGLSRTRKACHLVSCGRLGANGGLSPSYFLRWLRPLLEERIVNKDGWIKTEHPYVVVHTHPLRHGKGGNICS